MRRYLLVAGTLVLVFLLAFVAVEAAGVPLLTDPRPWMSSAGGTAAAAVGIGLLLADVFIPVPSSFVMVAHGALFGVVPGMILSLVGSTGAALFGFWIGRRGGPLLARVVRPEEQARADRLLKRWGPMAIVLTRPIPMVAETVAILAGASPLRWGLAALAALAGNLPAALLYALTGAYANNVASASLMFGLVLLLTAVFWLIGRRLGSGAESPGEG